jgi:O-antigen/teichoic acid export membrane protein
MLGKAHLTGATWTLADQAVVSLGTFAINIILARQLAPAEYGIYALIYGTLLTLQLLPGSLFYYPLSVRLSNAPPGQREALVGASILLTVIVCIPLCLILALVLILLERADLIVPVLTFFFLWQVQEAARRSLFSDFRHRDALPGDVVSYIGQAVAVFLISLSGPLSLANAIYVMAATSGIAALIQTRQVSITLPGVGDLVRMGSEFWKIGNWSLANNFVSIARIQIFPWTLAWLVGPAAVATFQAAFNVANLVNPVMIGLCNLIPQTAAKAHPQGKRQA